ncbi:hypothetical protein [Microbacterium hominis]|uniref:Uncharacterized protein n=1 Tax=Microbacterium hominis TaxID=162426 RepID=A0A7D4Q2Y2_9MICO|nr:hypothetical protein [Microbacterium hominis]QKJ19731.1 hypothetical protein HQM25_10395 [Microbacterium hominis]
MTEDATTLVAVAGILLGATLADVFHSPSIARQHERLVTRRPTGSSRDGSPRAA